MDYSTAHLVREKALSKDENLMGEKLARLDPEQMVKQILAKAGVISFSRMSRILKDTFVIAKQESFEDEALLKVMLNHSSLAVPDRQLFVAKSDLIFDSKRD